MKPGLMGYIKKTGAALKSILKNPMPFLGNLVSAAKLGFTNFADNIVEHLKTGLIDWLTGSLEGVYIPKALSLLELGKFALSVLGHHLGADPRQDRQGARPQRREDHAGAGDRPSTSSWRW